MYAPLPGSFASTTRQSTCCTLWCGHPLQKRQDHLVALDAAYNKVLENKKKTGTQSDLIGPVSEAMQNYVKREEGFAAAKKTLCCGFYSNEFQKQKAFEKAHDFFAEHPDALIDAVENDLWDDCKTACISNKFLCCVGTMISCPFLFVGKSLNGIFGPCCPSERIV